MSLTAKQIVERWENGRSTASGMVLDVLSQTDKKVVAEALEIIPPDILKQLEEFVGYYTTKTQIFNGPRPNARTLRYVREWFGSRRPAASA